MKIQLPLLLLMMGLLVGCEEQPSSEQQPAYLEALKAAISNPERKAENRARDSYRHPLQTLRFFDVQPDMSVVELWPGGGWYTEILAPYLQAGKFYLAHYSSDSSYQYRREAREHHRQWVEENDYDHISITELSYDSYRIAPPDSVDRVLTFRNLHNWLDAGYLQESFQAAWDALKPGGIFAVVEHRAPPNSSLDFMKRSGYVSEEVAKKMAQKVGFVLIASSAINNNPEDTKDYEKGVWTLPPTLRLGEQDRDKYLAIGESDRMTLKFVKPVQ